MLKSLTSFLGRLAAGLPGASGSFQPVPGLAVQAGDVVAQPGQGGWLALKVIAVDGDCVHCLSYEPAQHKPALATLSNAAIRIAHAVHKAADFAEGWEPVGNQAATPRELQGLKYMDFALYLRLTGQEAEAIAAAADRHYQKAKGHAAEGRSIEAINEYGKAIELFPLFHEALDSRAFAFMALGLHQQALRDLEESLYIEPDGVDAFFAKGECLMKLGHLDEAAAVFTEGQELFPNDAQRFAEFLKRTRAFALTGRPS